jgi:rRNA maturation protein Nop10
MKVLDAKKSECVEEIELCGEHTLYGTCPNCGEFTTDLWCPSYCGDCGQKIEWE